MFADFLRFSSLILQVLCHLQTFRPFYRESRNLQAVWVRKPDCHSGLHVMWLQTTHPCQIQKAQACNGRKPQERRMARRKLQSPQLRRLCLGSPSKNCLALGSKVRFLYVLKDALQLSRQNSDGPSNMNTCKGDGNKDCQSQNQDHKSHSRSAKPYRPTTVDQGESVRVVCVFFITRAWVCLERTQWEAVASLPIAVRNSWRSLRQQQEVTCSVLRRGKTAKVATSHLIFRWRFFMAWLFDPSVLIECGAAC